MRVESDITIEDLRAVRRRLLRTSAVQQAAATEFVIGAFLGFVPYGVMAAAARAEPGCVMPPRYVLGLAAAQLGVWTILYAVALWTSIGRSARHFACVATGRHVLSLSEGGIHEVRPQGDVTHVWSAVTELYDEPKHIFIAVGADGHYIIPKRSFVAGGEAEFVARVCELRRKAGDAA